MIVKPEGCYRKAFYALSRAKTASSLAHGTGQLLLEVGIEDFDVEQRRFRDGHAFRPDTQ